MAYGINFNNNSGARVLDGKHLIPQKVATYDMARDATSIYDGTENDGTGAHPGYRLRTYWFNNPFSQQSRPVVYFWEFPDHSGQDIWLRGAEIACQVQYGVNVNPGLITPPKVHIFALDYVTRSNASTGLRAWNPDNGQLIYDSGQQHLSIQQIFNIGVDTTLNTDYPRGTIMSFDDTLNYLPWEPGYAGVRGPAMTIPSREGYVQYANRFGNEYEWRYGFFYRIHGRTMDTRCMRTEFSMSGEGGANYRYAPYTSGANMSTVAIYGSNYR